jgi:hypothetical protein
MSVNTLDRTKHFGTVNPPENGAHFWQNGFYYDNDGHLCEHMMDDAARMKKRGIDADAAAARAAIAARNEYLRSQGVATPESQAPPAEVVQPPELPDDSNIPPTEIDFRGWLLGTKTYNWMTVRSAVRTIYKRDCVNIDALRDFLVDEVGHAKPDEIGA